MYDKAVLSVATALFALAAAQAKGGGNPGNNGGQNGGQNGGNNNAAAADANPALLGNCVQAASSLDGQAGLGAAKGQVKSTTSKNNFINFCDGKTVTNGLQIIEGSCNGIVMGDIPSKQNMVSSIILFPKNGDVLPAGKDFNVTVATSGLKAGSFTNAQVTYYAAPQQLSDQGTIIGHTHVTIQDMGGTLNPTKPLDPTAFAFFLGVNDAGDGKGTLTAPVVGGLGEGSYRACTMTSSSNHAPVIMPVAQRGSQDDCTKFTVSGGGGGANNGTANKGGGNNAQANKGAPATKGTGNNDQTNKNVGNNSGAKPPSTATPAKAPTTGTKPQTNTNGAKNPPAKPATGTSKKPPAKPNNKRRFVGLSDRVFVA